MVRKTWSDLTSAQRASVIVSAALQFALAATAWVDLARRDASEINGSKARWATIIAINYVGPAAYFLKGRKRTDSYAG
jgi:hypothetical protein